MKNIFWDISILIFSVTIFFGYMIMNLHILLFLAVLFAIMGILIGKKYTFKFARDEYIWFLAIFICSFSILYSKNRKESIIFTFMFIMAYIFKVIFQGESEKYIRKMINIFYVFSGIHVIATILMKVYPQIIIELNQRILTFENLKMNLDQLNLNHLAGITGQVGVNAFYLAIFVGISYCKIISKKKIKYVFFTIIGFICIGMTGKRGMLIFSVLGISLLMFISLKSSLVSRRRVLLCSFLILVLVTIYGWGYINEVMERNKVLINNGDFTNGRALYWKETIKSFWNSPILGHGINSIDNIIGTLPHNVYLQLLSDV